jgi:hypothetical protein
MKDPFVKWFEREKLDCSINPYVLMKRAFEAGLSAQERAPLCEPLSPRHAARIHRESGIADVADDIQARTAKQ